MENQNNNSSNDGRGNNLLFNIIGNALSTSQKHVAENSGVQTRKCSSCGAARPESTDLSTCDYCGFQFYETTE
jgi:hypothetical protein